MQQCDDRTRDSYPVVEIAAELSCQPASQTADLLNATEPAVALNPTELCANWPNLSSDDTRRN